MDAVDLLVEAGAAIVGIDSLNIDDPADLTRPAHSGLLAAGIPICEHLTNLAAVPVEGASFSAIPPRSVERARSPSERWRPSPRSPDSGHQLIGIPSHSCGGRLAGRVLCIARAASNIGVHEVTPPAASNAA